MEKKELRKYSIWQSLIAKLQIADFNHDRIWQTVSAKLKQLDDGMNVIVQTVFAQLQVGLSNCVFISKYQLNVPSTERMTEFLRKENEGLYNKEEKV